MQSADVIRAALMSFTVSLLNVLILAGLPISIELAAGINVLVAQTTILVFLFIKWPNGKEPHP